MAIRILTDSTCDLTNEELQELDVTSVVLRVVFEDGIYRDRVDITPAQFYEKQAGVKVLPKTTQANPQEFCTVMEKLLANGDEVVGIFLSSKLSGTYQSAAIAKEMVVGGERVHLVDSLNVTVGLALLVRAAARMRDEGCSAAEIVAKIEELRSRVRLIAFVQTLKYLKMGGRISGSTAVLGTMLGISPVVAVVDGEVKSVGKVKGRQKILEYTLDFIRQYPIDTRYPVAFPHSCAHDMVRTYREKISHAFDLPESSMSELGAVIGTHVGPGCYGIAYIEQERPRKKED